MTQYSLTFNQQIRYDVDKPGITVPVGLQIGNLKIQTEAKLDTGATFCIFERFLGKSLGLDIEQGDPQKISTVMGSFWTYGHSVTLLIEDYTFDSVVYFAADPNFRRNVLGRFGFLQKILVGLNDYDGEFYLGNRPDF